MTFRSYNLRARSAAGVANRSGWAIDISPLSPSCDPARDTAGPDPETEVIITLRIYSDVVASRPPSPRKERPLLPSESSDNDGANATYRLDNENHVSSSHNRFGIAKHTSGDVSDPIESKEEFQWTTVKRRRARSHSFSNEKKAIYL